MNGWKILKNSIGHCRNIIKHKFWVYYYGRKYGVNIWQLLTHDLSKFHPTEFLESIKWYQGYKSPILVIKKELGWSKAWLHHKSHNKHHSDYWLDIIDGKLVPIKMPYKYVMEMLVDWLAAGRTYNGSDFTFEDEKRWWEELKRKKPRIHKQTIILIDFFFNFEGDWKEFKRTIKIIYDK